MKEAVVKKQDTVPLMEYGWVIQSGEGLSVETRFGTHAALRALSCLVKPEQGDRVVVTLDEPGDCFILAVLERPEAWGADLEFEGDVNFRVGSGTLRVMADEELQLAAGENLGLTSRNMEINAQSAEANIERVSFWGRLMNLHLDRVELTAKSIVQNARRLTQWLTESFRSVEDHDEIQAGSARYLVDETLTVQSGNEIHIAEEDVKIDAEQIHLG